MTLYKSQKNLPYLISQLQNCCVDLKEKLSLEKRVREIKNQNDDLSKSLGKLKAQIFEEKERNLRLRSEIAYLKIQEVDAHKKIQALLSLANVAEPSIEVFLQKDCRMFEPKLILNSQESIKQHTDHEILQIKLKAMKAELNERTELLLCERDSLMREKLCLLREVESKHFKENEELNLLLEKITLIQSALHHMENSPNCNANILSETSSTKFKENVASQTNHDFKEAGNNDILIDIDRKSTSSHQLSVIKNLEAQLSRSKATEQRLKSRISILQNEIDKLSNSKKSSGSSQNLNERVRILTERNKKLEERRKLENEGFRSEIKILRDNLKEIEKQLLKIVFAFGESKGINVDLSSLEAIDKSMKGTGDILIRLRDLQSQLSSK